MRATSLSAGEARRIALAAQGFGHARTTSPSVRRVYGVAHRLHALQIDTVNVLVRAHYLPIFSRLGPYPRSILDRLTNETHALIEHRRGHQASYLPVELEPLLRWRREEARHQRRLRWRESIDPGYIDAVEAQVIARGPLTLSDLEDARRIVPSARVAASRRDGQPYATSSLQWWRPSEGKTVLDGLLLEGRLALAGRRGAERLYDLAERVIPAEVLRSPTPAGQDARRELVRLSASALGIATTNDLANYFELKVTDTRAAVRDLLDEGELLEVGVEGWKGPIYLVAGTKVPRSLDARTFLGPFDSLTWSRERTRRLFDFAFSFEIYVPEPKRRFGYYVLPFLLGDTLVARADLKADRARHTLQVLGAYSEPGARARDVAAAMKDELRQLGAWLALDRVECGVRGELAALLA